MKRTHWIVTLALVAGLGVACRKAENSPPVETPRQVDRILAYAMEGLDGCDHDLTAGAAAKHAWPFPAEARDIRWGEQYQRMRLKLKPTNAAFVTATVTWKKGALIEVEDSEIVVQKPRKVLAKHDMFVTRKIWDQGVEVERTVKVVSAGEVANFLFYNSRGSCMIQTEYGAEWTKCDLDGSFEGVSVTMPFACEQTWWVKVRKSKVDQGWMPFEEAFMVRVPPEGDAAK